MEGVGALPYIANTDADRAAMLAELGLRDVEELFADIPPEVRLDRALDLPPALSEPEAVRLLQGLAAENGSADKIVCFLGGGAYDHHVPAVVAHLLLRGEFFTAYTPYQAEISQGTLQAIYEFQSMICALTGMDAANASMYDGASALAEAALMAHRVNRRRRILVARTVNPAYREVVRTYAGGAGLVVEELPFVPRSGVTDVAALRAGLADDVAVVLLQEPNFFGLLEPVAEIGELVQRAGALFAVSADPVSLGMLEPPAGYGADIVTGEGQPLGLGLNFGGPNLGFFAVRQSLVRQLPGRVAGAAADAAGRRGFVLTLQTREQHIRRERATSNICSNQALAALAATIHLSWLGPAGLRRVAELCLAKARYAARRIGSVPGYRLAFDRPFFREFVVRCPHNVGEVLGGLREQGILAGLDLGRWYPELPGHLLIAVTEKRTRAEIDRLAALLPCG